MTAPPDTGSTASPAIAGEALFRQDFFQLFDLPARFELDGAQLDARYRALQAQVHPDKFAHLSEAEQRLAMQSATRVNEAYQALRRPVSRARYLLALRGVDTQEESNTAMPLDFLMQQMEWREITADAAQQGDIGALTAIEQRLQAETHVLQQQLRLQLDDENHYNLAAAAGTVRKLRFLEKLAEEIVAAFDETDI